MAGTTCFYSKALTMHPTMLVKLLTSPTVFSGHPGGIGAFFRVVAVPSCDPLSTLLKASDPTRLSPGAGWNTKISQLRKRQKRLSGFLGQSEIGCVQKMFAWKARASGLTRLPSWCSPISMNGQSVNRLKAGYSWTSCITMRVWSEAPSIGACLKDHAWSVRATRYPQSRLLTA